MDPQDVAHAYDAWAGTYDSEVNATRDLDAAVLRATAPDLQGCDVVELGCGTGKNTVFLMQRARSLVGLDFSPNMLARARQRVGDAAVRFVEHDIRQPLPLSAGCSDVVVASLVLEHVQALGGVYAEVVRILRPGGRLLICELHPERQRRGGQAHFRDAATGDVRLVPAYRHTTAEYVNEGIAAGLRLAHLGEWLEEGAPDGAPPRLLSLSFSHG